MHMGGYRILAVFLEDSKGWRLTDCLSVDDFGIEDTSHIPLMTRDDGSPGAWLGIETIGHGTGVYWLFEEWYNVFAGAYEVIYSREGWDNIAHGHEGGYYETVLTHMSIEDNALPAMLPFTTWKSLLLMRFNDNATEEITRHVITGLYVYDAATATYSLQERVVREDADAPSPASEFFRKGP